MSFINIILISIGLASDACAVSLAKALNTNKKQIRKLAFILPLSFAFFQALMPLIGYLIGKQFINIIAPIDHFIAFFLLSFIGLKMIKESREQKDNTLQLTFKNILILSIATSIDALASGISFIAFNINIIQVISIIFIITWLLCFICIILGEKIGKYLKNNAEIIGGIILILIGTKILIEHLF